MDIEVDEFLFFSETIYPNKERHILNLFFRIHRNKKKWQYHKIRRWSCFNWFEICNKRRAQKNDSLSKY